METAHDKSAGIEDGGAIWDPRAADDLAILDHMDDVWREDLRRELSGEPPDSSRPTAAEIFAFLGEVDTLQGEHDGPVMLRADHDREAVAAFLSRKRELLERIRAWRGHRAAGGQEHREVIAPEGMAWVDGVGPHTGEWVSVGAALDETDASGESAQGHTMASVIAEAIRDDLREDSEG